ncbi:GTP-binding protein [Pseudotabrizicola sp. 4114]|uniref:CobW family GTP-binding protein n=1 Tax=Pseudotabrizicola sp. 4114 TaxID=2817731 RepID=UPI00285BFE81|nr:G3E family GTPase [Pseudorhodobacter sp. 4114]
MDLGHSPSAPPYQMKILVVSGFLGSGKTTFISSLVRDRKLKFCVLENEFADSTIDSTLLRQEAGLDVIELASGCICCTSTGDLVAAVMSVFGSIRPEVLIIETTGVGMLSNVLAILRTIEHDALAVLKPVSIVDAGSFYNLLSSKDAVFLDQIKSAGTVVLSKCETMPVVERMGILQEIRKLNPTIVDCPHHYSRQAPDWWRGLLTDEALHGHVKTIEAPVWESFSLKEVQLFSEFELLQILDLLSGGEFGDIQRAKGILQCGEQWVKFDFVSDRYTLSTFPDSSRSNVVFIGKFILREKIQQKFRYPLSSGRYRWQ